MYFPLFTRLLAEDLGSKPPESSLKLLYQLNLVTDYIKSAFSSNIAIENTTFQTKQLQITGGATPAANALTFQVSLPPGYIPKGLSIIQCFDTAGGLVGSAVWAEMAAGLQNGNQIKINAIYGLTANHTYSVTFLVL